MLRGPRALVGAVVLAFLWAATEWTAGSLAPEIGIGDTSRCHPSHTTGHTGHVPGGSTRLSLVRNMKSRETERVEVVVAQGLLDRRVS